MPPEDNPATLFQTKATRSPDTPEFRARLDASRTLRAAEDHVGGYLVDPETGRSIAVSTPGQLAAVRKAAARFATAEARYVTSLRRPTVTAPRTLRPTASKAVARRGTTTRRTRSTSSGRSPDDSGEPPPPRPGSARRQTAPPAIREAAHALLERSLLAHGLPQTPTSETLQRVAALLAMSKAAAR